MLILIPLQLDYDFPCDYQQKTIDELVSHGHEVWCFSERKMVSPLGWLKKNRQLKSGVSLFNPIKVLPFSRFSFIAQLNIRLSYFLLKLRLKFNSSPQKIIWTFTPEFTYFVTYFKKNTSCALYDQVDYNGFETDFAMIKRVDFHFVNSRTLYNIYHRASPTCHLVVQGFSDELFKKPSQRPPRVLTSSSRPKIGFIGQIGFRLDFKLLYELISNNPQWDFVLWGPRWDYFGLGTDPRDEFFQTEKELKNLEQLPNIIWGKSQKSTIPQVINTFDVAMIPYTTFLEFNRYCYPMKVLEYFYQGKPVIATPIEELTHFPQLVKMGSTAKEWQRHIKQLLAQAWPSELKQQQRKIAIQNSWKNKVNQILTTIDQTT
jgi:glycosyltransferase involved in cell wall biosynthesis